MDVYDLPVSERYFITVIVDDNCRSMRPDADPSGNRKPLDRGQIDTSISFADVAGQELAKSEVHCSYLLRSLR
jgi:hypothetical protein